MSMGSESLVVVRESEDSLVADALDALRAEAAEAFDGARSENTRIAYDKAWHSFAEWCDEHRLDALPASPETAVLYLTALARRCKLATLRLHLTAINVRHRDAGLDQPGDFPPMRTFMRGLAKRLGSAPAPKRALTPEQIAGMIDTLDLRTRIGLRDRAVLLLGLAMAARRSELVALDLEDLEERDRGLRVRIRFSKTDQEGRGAVIGIPRTGHPELCPVGAVRAWIEGAELTAGPLFRAVDRHGRVSADRLGSREIARIVKAGASRIGLAPDQYAAHSLRSGFATAAAEGGAEERDIMRQTRHASERMVRRYIQEGTLFGSNPAADVLGRVAAASRRRDE